MCDTSLSLLVGTTVTISYFVYGSSEGSVEFACLPEQSFLHKAISNRISCTDLLLFFKSKKKKKKKIYKIKKKNT